MTYTPTPNLSVIPSPNAHRDHALKINQCLNKTDSLQLSGTVLANSADVNLATGYVYRIAGTQVVGPRQTGWTADTGTAEKTAHATYTKGANLTFTDPPTAAEMSALNTRIQNIETALQNFSRGQKAIKDALTTHGIIGS